MAREDRYQSLKAGSIGTRRCWVPIAAEGALSPRRRLSTIAMLPIPRADFHVPLNPDAHPTSRFGKSVRRNLAAPTVDHKNKWESAGLMDGYYVVGITAIPYP